MDKGAPSGPGCSAEPEPISVVSADTASIPSAVRPWQPHERNYSGGRFGVWHDDEWTMLRIEAGIADATASIRKNEAWDLATRLSPALVERMKYLFDEMKKAQHALHQFTWADTLSPLLRKIADDWDCDSSQCEFASDDMGGLSCPCMEDERGCRAVEADELRQFAVALETASAIEARRAETGNTDSVHESAVAESQTPIPSPASSQPSSAKEGKA